MKKATSLIYKSGVPGSGLSDFVKCFWALENTSPVSYPVDILPDGHFDILFVSVGNSPFKGSLIGLGTIPCTFEVPAHSLTLAISFKLLASEYILKSKLDSLLDSWQYLPEDHWILRDLKFDCFDSFVNSATSALTDRLDKDLDYRKQFLFQKVHETNGDITVKQLSDYTSWKSRQINRYFQSNFGLSLKKYCNILRFRASFDHLNKGQLFPEYGYFDQPHFIRDVHKFSGTSPKQLAGNKEDRFIQLSTLSDP